MCPVCKETGRRWGELQSFLSWAVPAALWCRTCFWTTAVLGAEIKIVLFCMPSANHGNLFHILGSIILELPRSLSLEESMRYYKLCGLYYGRWDGQIWISCREFDTSEHLFQPVEGARSNLTALGMCVFLLVQ